MVRRKIVIWAIGHFFHAISKLACLAHTRNWKNIRKKDGKDMDTLYSFTMLV
uniref:Uncharacterized protein n=1 Tax=Rhizophora mucronata TaxID=61149 RepID=A0A2P2KZN1_RHIMU